MFRGHLIQGISCPPVSSCSCHRQRLLNSIVGELGSSISSPTVQVNFTRRWAKSVLTRRELLQFFQGAALCRLLQEGDVQFRCVDILLFQEWIIRKHVLYFL